MVDRAVSCKSENKHSIHTKSRKSSSASSEFDEEYREHLEGKYLGNGLEIRPPSGTNHQQPGSHLSIDTRLSELSLDDASRVHSSQLSTSARKKSDQYKVVLEKPNCYISSPFKQGYQVPSKGATAVVDPSIQLKKVTKESIDKVRQQFRRPKAPPHSSLYTARLRKAKLKTTGRPISGSGPSIKQCQGIQGGGNVKARPSPPVYFYNSNRSYSTHSPSIRPGSPTELHRPESSIHCTSRASSEIDDDIPDDIVDTTCSNDVTESWSRHTFHGDQTNDLNEVEDDRDQEGSLVTNSEGSNEAIGDEFHKSFINKEDSKFGDAENQLDDARQEQAAEFKQQIKDTASDTEDGDISKSSFVKNSSGACRPFSDGSSKDDDDDTDDVKNGKRSLISRYNHCNSNTEAWGSNKKVCGKNESNDRNRMKNKNGTNNNDMKRGLMNGHNYIIDTSCYSQNTMLSNSSDMIDCIDNSNLKKEQSLNNGEVHIVDSTSGFVSPLMTIHLRGKLENVQDDKPIMPVDVQPLENTTISNVDYPILDDVDNPCDTDRIPSAVIWENLDQLNLSMNASSDSSKDRFNFSKARKVQSAGIQRKMDTTNSIDTKPTRSKRKSRLSSSNSRKTKTKSPEHVDKAELLRKYLSDESRKFSADLPGYFTEQFHIIQEAQKEKFRETHAENQTKALVIVDCKEGAVEDKDCQSGEDSDEDKESKSLYSVEIEDPSSSGVFFTMDSVSSAYELDSLSVQTDDNQGYDSGTREFSDDTGFETMPGVGGTQTSGKSLDNDIRSEFKEEQTKFMNFEDLEVIAKAKHLTDPRASSHYNHCLPEPLNFSINAIPPPGYLFYFAYGVDMNVKRMSLYLRREYKRLWGILFGFKLLFNKKGSSNDAGGFANVEYSPGSSVEGCVYTMTNADLSMLDNCMGYPKHYCRVVLPVWMCNCDEPDQHGVAQYCVPAILYVAEQRWVETEHTANLDCTYSVNQCLKASDILTPNYVNYLNKLITT